MSAPVFNIICSVKEKNNLDIKILKNIDFLRFFDAKHLVVSSIVFVYDFGFQVQKGTGN